MAHQVFLSGVLLSLATKALADNYSTYPEVPKTASINGFADPIYAELPTCAQSCVEEDTGNTPCPYWDTGCLCVMLNWGNPVASCIADSCQGTDVSQATSLAYSICSSAGVGDPYWYLGSSYVTLLENAAAATSASATATASSTDIEASSTETASEGSASSTIATSSAAPESTKETGSSKIATSSAAPESTKETSSVVPSSSTIIETSADVNTLSSANTAIPEGSATFSTEEESSSASSFSSATFATANEENAAAGNQNGLFLTALFVAFNFAAMLI
ncbi:uncharacterized protein PRCAT00000006001 [Priceomyces carsonii]|uniref:uncharacterized protein n=1 Tax=Priceomyces carsonii TaxID=28549 RepID=UPI002EDA1742|nr:unnamed protein product [Priceomyces carsonii]